ncbi:BON domain-containing protein [Mucilaginibacter sp. PAMB04274]|uniref:BON domain-containing protein n=1 Tax=Mucilaginibacter sp. PAMB04274 TaxID=3138568 RepID=UPI0031F629A3
MDKEIKADLVTKAKTDVSFAGVSYSVEKGVVTLTGACATRKAKSEVEKTVKSIHLIKGLHNQLVVAPVILNNDFLLKQAVDSVLAVYPAVQASVAQNVVTLIGKAQKGEADKLIPAIAKLKPASIDNQLQMY